MIDFKTIQAGKIVVELIKEAGLYVMYKSDDTNKHFGVKV